MEENKQLSRHEQKAMKREERDRQREEMEHAKSRSRLTKNLVRYGGIALVVVALVAGIFVFGNKGSTGNAVKEQPYTSGQVHWHASLEVFTCDRFREMPKPIGGADTHLGTPLLHTHKDGLIHIEGRIYRKQDIMLGKYMDNLDVEFDEDKIMDYVNGDGCNDGKENKVRMQVNGKDNFEFRNYVINDGDKIVIKYE